MALRSIPAMLKMKHFPTRLVPDGSFDGKRVLVTGGTTGLGFAAAAHFISLGASEVVITGRSQSKGEAAGAKLESAAGPLGKGKIRVMELEMTSYDSIVAFVERLKGKYSSSGGLDVVMLNAGVTNMTYKKTNEGFEETIAVNAINTTLLAALMIDWLKTVRPQRQEPAHLSIVSSMNHMYPEIQEWEELSRKEGILHHFSKQEEYSPMGLMHYNISKLLLQYAVEGILPLANDASGQPQVIVNTFCPGLASSELGRSYVMDSKIMQLGKVVFYGTLGQRPDIAARLYPEVGLTSTSDHGKFISRWPAAVMRVGETKTSSPTGRRVQAVAWEEIRVELVRKIPQARAIL